MALNHPGENTAGAAPDFPADAERIIFLLSAGMLSEGEAVAALQSHLPHVRPAVILRKLQLLADQAPGLLARALLSPLVEPGWTISGAAIRLGE